MFAAIDNTPDTRKSFLYPEKKKEKTSNNNESWMDSSVCVTRNKEHVAWAAPALIKWHAQ